MSRVAERTGWPLLAEAWRRLRPLPPLGYRTARELLALERSLLREERRRWSEALDRAKAAPVVLLDTGFLGPLTYTWGLSRFDPRAARVLPTLLGEARRSFRRGAWGMPDLTLYLDTPLPVARRRAARAPMSHPVAWRARHAAVGYVERAFWLGTFSGLAPGALRVLDGRDPLARLAGRVRSEAARARRRPTPRDPTPLLRALGRAAPLDVGRPGPPRAPPGSPARPGKPLSAPPPFDLGR